MSMLNDWRFMKFRPGKAHLWALTRGGVWRSLCGGMCVLDLDESTGPLAVGDELMKCKRCIPVKPRRKAAL